MEPNVVFNMTVCIIGIAFLLIHTVDLLLKKNKRTDENNLLAFIVFTAFHFAIYLSFIFIKLNYKNDNLIMGFYTAFYIMNNIEILLLFLYTMSYVSIKKKSKDTLMLINFLLFFAFVVLDIVNVFNHMFFFSYGGEYQRTKVMFISQGYQVVAFAMVFIVSVFNKKLDKTEKIAFSLYCMLPFVAIVLQNLFKGYAIAYLSIVISIEILFLFVNVRKNILLAKQAEKNKEAEIKIMMSQIQPHFIYNTLASISTLIKIDPDKAQEGLDDFTDYLRANLTSLTETKLIPFSDELKHITTYLSLEKMRFDDRLEIITDIQTKDFLVPPLSIQPLVENAIKHGILKKLEGGRLIFKTYETPDAYIVEISDNGVGFDVTQLDTQDNKHVGLNNVKHRLNSMCNSDMIVDSEINKGTNIKVLFYK